jgi:ElaB/YqjD/DUF883 family membrane-anchored ribosome-binding protein
LNHKIEEGFMTGVKQTAEGGAAGSEESTEQAKERVQETAQEVGQKAQEVRGRAGERVRKELDTRSTQAGEQVSTTAEAIRRLGAQMREDGNHSVANYADQVAERVERLGSYLSHSNADRVLHDVESFARRQPWLVAFGGAAAGFLASRFVKASSANRYRETYAGNGSGRAALPARATGESAMAATGEPSGVTGGRSEGRGDL